MAWFMNWIGAAWRRDDRRCRAALADIDESDLSESGRRIRQEVLRERRERERRKGAAARPTGRANASNAPTA